MLQKRNKILIFSSISLVFLTFGLNTSYNNIEALVVKSDTQSGQMSAESTELAMRSSSSRDSNTYSRGDENRELEIAEPDIVVVTGLDINTNVVDAKIRIGDSGEEVLKLQQNLKKMEFFKEEPTGFFGLLTNDAVVDFQVQMGIMPDGIVGTDTLKKIESAVANGVIAKPKKQPEVSNTNSQQVVQAKQSNTQQQTKKTETVQAVQSQSGGKVELLSWFGGVENVFSIGSVAKVIDVDTGLSFQVKRTYGYNHADVETVTAEDTQKLKNIAGGFNWTRRAVIVEVNGRRLAASVAPMPHAGLDGKPANVQVSGRSGDYGTGDNLDAVKGNAMDGHFDIHFYNSRTHASNSVDSNHQAMVQKAYRSGK